MVTSIFEVTTTAAAARSSFMATRDWMGLTGKQKRWSRRCADKGNSERLTRTKYGPSRRDPAMTWGRSRSQKHPTSNSS